MTTSGTYSFLPSYSDITLGAFDRIQIRSTDLTTNHLMRAAHEANLQLVEWSNKQPNLWTSEGIETTLLEGINSYVMPGNVVMILIGYIRTLTWTQQNDRVMMPVGTVEYQSYPNKNTTGPPTVYWFNRQVTPQITVWPVPDSGDYTLVLQCVRQIQDANMASGGTPELPYRFMDAFESGLAWRLARIYAPALEAQRKADAMEAWTVAANQDSENVTQYITPMLGAYTRNLA